MKALWWALPIEAIIVTVAQLALRFDVAHAVLTFVVAASVTVLLTGLPDIQVPRWERVPSDRPDGTRDRISMLSWAFMTRDDLVSVRGVQAVQQAATVRLALHGIDLADPDHAPAAQELLGASVYTQLSTGTSALTMTDLARCIDRLAAIEPDTHALPAPHAPAPVTDLHLADSPAHSPSPRTT